MLKSLCCSIRIYSSIRRVQPDQYPIPRICDECKSPCISECLFGESFCSRACFRKSWKTVFENASFKILLSKMEMAEILTIREKEIAQGIINDVQEAARIELRKVKKNTYLLVDIVITSIPNIY